MVYGFVHSVNTVDALNQINSNKIIAQIQRNLANH